MKNLSKDEVKRQAELVQSLADAKDKVDNLVNELNNYIVQINAAIDAYNDVVNEANGFREDIASSIEGYIDERSDAWRDGDKGQQYNEWLMQWQEEFNEADHIPDVDMPEMDAGELLEQLVSAPDET